MTPSPHQIHQHQLEQLAIYLRESEQLLADWDTYSDEHTDLDGWPHDAHAYGMRAGQRDADTWHAFNRVRSSAKQLLATAETQLRQLPADQIQSRWSWQLAVLDTALDYLAALQDEWLDTRDSLPASARPGTAEYDDARAERDADAWHYLGEWASHGQALREINSAARKAPSSLAPPPITVPAPGRRTPARK